MNLIKKIGPEELEEILKQDDVLAKIAEALRTLPGLDPKTEAAIAIYDEKWQVVTGPIVYSCDGLWEAIRSEMLSQDGAQRDYFAAHAQEYVSEDTDSMVGVPIIDINVSLFPEKKQFPGGIGVAPEGILMANTLDIALRRYEGSIKAAVRQISPKRAPPYDQWEKFIVGEKDAREKMTRRAELSYDPKAHRWTDLSALKSFEVHVIEDTDLS